MKLAGSAFILEDILDPDVKESGYAKSQTYRRVIFAVLYRHDRLPRHAQFAGQ